MSIFEKREAVLARQQAEVVEALEKAGYHVERIETSWKRVRTFLMFSYEVPWIRVTFVRSEQPPPIVD
jgi:hypothetical protein